MLSSGRAPWLPLPPMVMSKKAPPAMAGPGGDGEAADVHAGAIVHAVDGVAREALEQVVLEHGEGAAAALLAGLEDEVDGAAEVAGLGEVLGGAEEHGGVAVMAAGVHLAWHGAAPGQAGGLG